MFFPYFYLLMFYQCGTVFQTAFLTTCYNPETSSRVTLASRGIGFQPNLMVIGHLWIKHQYKKTEKNIFVYFYLLIFFQHDKTIRQQILQNCLTIRILSTKKNKGKICKYRLLSVPLHPLFDRKAEGEMLEWLKRHAWKACIRQKRIGGSNPPLSAVIPKDPLKISGSFFLIVD